MSRRIAFASLVMVLAWCAFGQTAAFEVASVKVSAESPNEGKGRRGLKTPPGSVTIQNLPLAAIVRWAYGVKEYQVEGPSWTESQGFDVFAKSAGPAKDAELQSMMQALLAERFKLAIHRETRDLPIYEMTLAKGGHKMRPSASEGESSFAPPKEGQGKLIGGGAANFHGAVRGRVTPAAAETRGGQDGAQGQFRFFAGPDELHSAGRQWNGEAGEGGGAGS